MEVFEVYQLYNALKLHFTSNYDFFKYQGKTNVKRESFEKSKLKFSCLKLSRKYSNLSDVEDLLISNFINDPKIWIGEIVTDKGEDNYLKWKKYYQSFNYNFKSEIEKLFEQYTPKELLKVEQNGLPPLIKEYQQNNIHFETLCLLTHFFGVLPKWKDQIEDDILYPSIENKINKYLPFLLKKVDILKCKKTLREVLENGNYL